MANLLKASGRVAGILLAVGLALSAQTQQNRMANPGTVNYIEGQVSLNGRTLTPQSIGSATAAPGQVLETQNGRAEMLLTPGVFLRLNNNSSVRMVSPDLVNTQIELLKGQAMLEGDYVTKDNRISVIDNGFTINIEKNGVYNFDAANPMISVYDGEARVTVNDKTFNVKKGKELALVATNQKLKEQSFDVNSPNQLYSWSRVRAGYMAQANQAMVQNIYVGSYPGWWGGYGWYWNPYFDSFAFVPGYGYWGSPFGFAFYSPAYFGAYGFRGGYFGHPVYRGVAPAYRGVVGGGFHGNGGFARPAFGGGGGFRGGGFAGGGFHGNGGFGGRR